MNLRNLLGATLLMPLAALGGTSANYSIDPITLDNGGLYGMSANYTVDFSASPGGAGSSLSYTASTGFAAQRREAIAIGLELFADSLTLNEGGTRQLGATLLFDDTTTAPLAADDITWSVQSGPLTGISTTGLASAAAVYQNTAVVAQGTYQAFTSILHLVVLNTNPDNFGAYSGDGLDDVWQVQNFGIDNANASPTANSDGDSFNNLLEFAFGTDPNDASSGPGSISDSGGLITGGGPPRVRIETTANGRDFRALFGRRRNYIAFGLTYTVQFSADLLGWENSTATPIIVASDAEMDVVTVPYPFSLSNGRKARFFRVQVTGP